MMMVMLMMMMMVIIPEVPNGEEWLANLGLADCLRYNIKLPISKLLELDN